MLKTLAVSCTDVIFACCLFSFTASAQQSQTLPPPPPDQPPASAPPAHYDKAIFQSPVPADLLTGLKQFSGQPTKILMHDKQFRHLLHTLLPACEFHYGQDMSLDDAVDMVMKDSPLPVQLLEGRYLLLSGSQGPYLSGRGFLWFDLQDGLFLGGFSFHPTNGEPTPTLALFSKQIRQEPLSLVMLPPAFAEQMTDWQRSMGVPLRATRYFITGSNRRVLLEHDEEYCSAGNAWSLPAASCEQADADAADIDETAAYYLDQVHYATNATAWMVGPDQMAWLQVRANTCGGAANPLGCRILFTRTHTRMLLSHGHRG